MFRTAVRTAAFVLSVSAALAGAGEAPTDADRLLDRALERLARVATLYRDQALQFTCDETVYSTGAGRTELRRFRYIYRYSDEKGGLLDVRIPRDEKPTPESLARDQKTSFGFPSLLARAYSWVFVFDAPNHDAYHYRLLGEGEALGRPALEIGFEAVPPYDPDVNAWCGTAWVDRSTWQLLRVEAVAIEECPEQAAYEAKLAEPADGTGLLAGFSFSRFETDFDVEKNGLRLPGRTVIDRRFHRLSAVRGRVDDESLPVFRVSQTYSRYRFTSVRTRDEIRRIVDGPPGN